MSGNEPFDINIHDTFIVIHYIHFAILISILFVIIGFGYWIMQKANKTLSKWLNLIHLLITIGGFLIIFLLLNLYREGSVDSTLSEFEFNENLNKGLFFIFFAILLAQMVYPINIIIGLTKK